jgi:hypothetical protein
MMGAEAPRGAKLIPQTGVVDLLVHQGVQEVGNGIQREPAYRAPFRVQGIPQVIEVSVPASRPCLGKEPYHFLF